MNQLRRRQLKIAWLALFILGAGIQVQGQSATGAIEGRVSDSQQLALPQTAVELQDAQGNTVRKVIGDAEGHFQLDSVSPGIYTLRFSHNGFETAAKRPVTVTDGRTTVLDVILQPQQVVQTITVTAPENDRLVASKTDIPTIALPVTVSTVPLELIQQQNSTDVVSAINNIPGANAWTQYGSLNYFVFRGFAVDHDPGSAVLLNGLRIEGNRADSQINSVESVDVLKGPASMLYGTEDTGGTINIVEKQPLPDPHYDVVLHGSRWGTGGIEFGATGPVRSDKLLYRFDAAFMHSDGFRSAGYNRLNISPKLYWRIGSRDQVHFNVGYNRDRFDGDAGIPLLPGPDGTTFTVPNIALSNRYNTPGNFEYLNTPVAQAFYEHTFSDNLRLREAFQYQFIGDEYWQSEGLRIDTSTTPLRVLRGPDDFSVYFFHRDHAALSQTDLDGSFHLIWNHQFVLGYEYDVFFHKTKRSAEAQNTPVPPIDLVNPVETATAVTSFPASRYDGLRNRSNAVYFQDYVRIHPKLQLLVGGRYDAYQHYDFLNPVVGGVEVIGPHQNVFSQRPFTYRVGLNSQLLPFFSVYTSYSTSFTAQTGLSTTGNTLKPETGKQFEVGGRFNLFQDRLSLNVAWYHIIQKNIAVARANGEIDQAGQQYSKGVEVELRGRVSQRLNVFASYGFTQTAYDDFTTGSLFSSSIVNLRGFVPGLVPKHTARIWTNYDLPKGFGVSLGGRYLSGRATDPFDIFWMGGFTTFDAALRYRRKRFDYSVNVSNFLSKTHYFVSAIDDFQIYPGPPIDVAATVRYRF
jgi:iron complex outermembrane receptor protein